jgi:hypothetical protein
MPTIPTVRAIAIPRMVPHIGGPDVGERRFGITVIPITPPTVDFSVVPLVLAFLPALVALAAHFPIPVAIAIPVPPVNPVAPVTPVTPTAPVIPGALVNPVAPIPLVIRHGAVGPTQ